MYKTKKADLFFDCVNYLILIGVVILTMYPMIYIILSSFSSPNSIMTHSGILLKPLEPTLMAYKMVFKNPMILSGYVNTLFIVVVGTGLNILLTSLGAYVLSRENVLLRKPIMLGIIFTMFFNGGMIPLFLTVKGLGMIDSLWAVFVPFSINTFNLLIMTTSFKSIPRSLEESAIIDGANHIQIMFRIVLPVAKATLAVMTLYYGVERWNGWFYAMIFLRDRNKFPLALILREILIQGDMENMTQSMSIIDSAPVGETLKYAVIVIATLPILTLYPFVQKYFVKGVMVGAVKG